MWPFRRVQEPKPEPKAGPVDGRTPITNLLKDMMAGGWSQDAIILAVHTAEQNAFRLLRTYQLTQQAEAVREQPADKPARRTKADMSTSTVSTQADNSVSTMSTGVDISEKKREKWRKQKENQRLKIVR